MTDHESFNPTWRTEPIRASGLVVVGGTALAAALVATGFFATILHPRWPLLGAWGIGIGLLLLAASAWGYVRPTELHRPMFLGALVSAAGVGASLPSVAAGVLTAAQSYALPDPGFTVLNAVLGTLCACYLVLAAVVFVRSRRIARSPSPPTWGGVPSAPV